VSAAWQVEQVAPSSGAPQLAQNRSEAGAEQLGQVADEVGGVVDDIASVVGVNFRCEMYIAGGGRGTVRQASFQQRGNRDRRRVAIDAWGAAIHAGPRFDALPQSD
jgi:hypothetical protein